MSVLLPYEAFTNALTVAEKAEPLSVAFSPDMTVGHAWEIITEEDEEGGPQQELFLVREGIKALGYVDRFDDFESSTMGFHIRDTMHMIPPHQIVSDPMPLLDLLPLFEQEPFFFVLSRNTIAHFVGWRDLEKLPMRLCIFALCLELESAMLTVLLRDGERIDDLLSLLPTGRREKAIELANIKRGRTGDGPSSDFVLLCTTLIDKVTLIGRSPHKRDRLPFVGEKDRRAFFLRTERIRNQIAHSGPLFKAVKTTSDLSAWVKSARDVAAALTAD